MSVINNNLLLTPEGYQISRSVRLRSSATAYLNRTPAGAGDRQKYTWSGWIKRGALPSSGNIGLFTVGATDAASDGLIFSGAGTLFLFFANATYSLNTSAILRDPSAWYHIVFSVDTTQATAANRVSLYVNGVQVTSFSAASYPTQNYNCYFNSAAIHAIGRQQQTSPSGYFDGYLTEVNFIDGQALTPSSFGETDAVTGVWKPKKYAGTYGTNGFYLNFSDPSAATAAAIGKDNSGNGNNWTPNNISVTAGVTYDSMLDVPTMWADGGNGRGNYAVVNPLDYKPSATTITQGNLYVSTTTSGCFLGRGTIAVSSGKWYWEAEMLGDYTVVGIDNMASPILSDIAVGATSTSYGYYNQTGQKRNNNSGSAYGATYTYGDKIGVALDLDAGTLTFYKNGTSQGTAFSSLSGTFAPAFSDTDVPSGTGILAVNFGQRPFAYTPPTGFKALNTQNLPEATIKKGNAYFDVVTRSGYGASGGNITSLQFQPDFSWSKSRNVVASNNLVDSVRGVSKLLSSDATAAEATVSTYITSFNSNGYTLGAGDYATTTTAVDWLWKESASAGFDIVTYTQANPSTLSHSLGVKPAMMIIKSRSDAENWVVWHQSLANQTTYALQLNTTTAQFSSANLWNSTAPTSTQFTVGIGAVNNGQTAVAYLFAEVTGFSKFGKYTGNGSADGPFVYLGFRPSFVMIKNSTGVNPWIIIDNKRSGFNVNNDQLYPNTSGAEDAGGTSAQFIDLTSNGFKLRNTATDKNGSGGTYIYAAFAENPFKNSLAR